MALASVVLGASAYETVVVHPAWSRQPPESFVGFMSTPISRMNIPAFWVPVAPLFALSALSALAVGLWVGTLTMPVVVSSASAVVSVGWTLVYFRPTIGRFLERGGGHASVEQIQSQVRRWILFNWIRVGLVIVAWCGALAALTTHA
jgi:hypothetical protein